MRRMRNRTLPRRPSDRLEDATTWLLTFGALVLLIGSILVGIALHGHLAGRAAVEAQERHQVTAVLLSDIPATTTPGARWLADVRWTDSVGIEHSGPADLIGPRSAGDAVRVWVTDDARVVDPPLTLTDAVLVASIVGATVAALGGAVLLGLGWAAMRGIWALHAAGWEREWELVEPRWRSLR